MLVFSRKLGESIQWARTFGSPSRRSTATPVRIGIDACTFRSSVRKSFSSSPRNETRTESWKRSTPDRRDFFHLIERASHQRYNIQSGNWVYSFMRIVIAPDKFKGIIGFLKKPPRLSRSEVKAACSSAESFRCPWPMGERESSRRLVSATGGSFHEAVVTDPLGKPVRRPSACWAMVERP